MKRAWIAVGLSVWALNAWAEQRTITHEDLWLMPRLAPAVISPDGSKAIVSVTNPAYDVTQQTSDLWLLDIAGRAAPKQLTQTPEAETGYVFSASGQRLAFSAQRAGDLVPQIYLLDLKNGGEAQRLSEAPGGARNPQFSPDGNSLLYISTVDATPAETRALNAKSSARIYDEFPIRFWDKWLDSKQQRIFLRRIDRTESARDLLAGSKLVSQPGFGGRQGENSDELDAVFSPDGQSVVFVASVNRHLGASQFTHASVYRVGLTGGEPELIIGKAGTEPADNYSRPRFAPDGKRLLLNLEARSEFVYNPTTLAVHVWPSAKLSHTLSAPNDGAVASSAWSSDSKSVLISTESAGYEELWQLSLSGDSRRISSAKSGIYSQIQVAARAPVLIAQFETATQPAEVVEIDLKRGSHRLLSSFSVDKAAALDLKAAEHFTTQVGPRSIHSMLIKPAKFDPNKRYPLFVLIHGGPHIMWRDQFFLRWNYHLIAGEERVVLLSNYKGSTGFGSDFARAIQGDPLKGPADEINAAADDAIRRFAFVDGSRTCAGGASYGGHLANWLQASTTRYRCLVSHAGLSSMDMQWRTSDIVYSREAGMGGPSWKDIPLWREQDPMQFVDNFKTPALVTFGELDYRVPINNGLEYWSMLKRQRIESRLIVFPDENHWILKGENSRLFYRELDAWLRKHTP
jgi:dipeptidyl aminopeptidase/acylaminoacyl peptidase